MDAKDPDGRTLLPLVCSHLCGYSVITFLSAPHSLPHSASPAVVDAKDPDGRTPLHFAAGYGQEDCVDVLLQVV